MNKTYSIFILFLFSLTLSAQEKSPFEACKNVVQIKESDYLKEKEQWDKKFTDCKGTDYQIISSSTLSGFSEAKTKNIPNLLATVSSVDFLSKVGQKTIATINKNITALKLTERCLKKEKVTENELAILGKGMTCEFLSEGIKLKMKENLPSARAELAFLGQVNIGAGDKALMTLNSKDLVDHSLSKSGGLIGGGVPHPKFKPLSGKEADKTKALYDLELLMIRSDWEKKIKNEVVSELTLMGIKPNESRFKSMGEIRLREKEKSYLTWGRSKLVENQKKHEAEYMKIMSKSPYLMHVGSENPTSEEILTSIPKLISSATKELERSEKILKSGTLTYEAYKKNYRSGSHQDAVDDLLYFLGNVPMVEMQLQEEKGACATASGLVDFIAQEKVKTQLALMGGLFGGIYFTATKVPAIIAVVTGISVSATTAGAIFGGSVGAYFQYEAYSEKKLAVEKFEAGVGSFEKVSETTNALNVQTALFPLDFIAVGAVLGKGSRSLARAKEVTAMKNAGVPEDAILALTSKADSSNLAISLPAQKEIARYGWSDVLKRKIKNDELELLTSLIEKGVLPPTAKRAKVAETLQLINKLNDEEKKGIAFMSSMSPKGTFGLLQVHQDIQGKSGNPGDLFQARLESAGIPRDWAKKMCQCARVCKILGAQNDIYSDSARMCML